MKKFIQLGEGLSDFYELLELANQMPQRVNSFVSLPTEKNGYHVTSLVLIMQPARQGEFQPIYVCLEGIPDPNHKPNQRFDLFKETADRLNKRIIELQIKPSTDFYETELYFQYVMGIFQMNRLLKI
ncbi:DUF7147 family protein [Sediminibacillus massiliensis]|uniref:DUF7147 family protein n=1 Tax=Sediminibacillus massiliensis TaxID=1926277 RepID=UPI0009886E71|nr:methylthioribose kinase [Sediminibacillus massiliensis]